MPMPRMLGRKSHPERTHNSRNCSCFHPAKFSGPLAPGLDLAAPAPPFFLPLAPPTTAMPSSSSSSSSPSTPAPFAPFTPAAASTGGPAMTSSSRSSCASPNLSSLNSTSGHPYATKSESSVNTMSTPPGSPLAPSWASAAICASASYGATMNSNPSRFRAAMSSCAMAGVMSTPCANMKVAPSRSRAASLSWPLRKHSARRSRRSFSSPPLAGSRSPSNTMTGVMP
mmetsp:Transcript_7734/g.35050  ORF Transcript_7734/g.35050 Transcript_7734/m.35050 type:complete len:227 (-) Transcript_7734:240-920(-)